MKQRAQTLSAVDDQRGGPSSITAHRQRKAVTFEISKLNLHQYLQPPKLSDNSVRKTNDDVL
jgi:hypothetical protein